MIVVEDRCGASLAYILAFKVVVLVNPLMGTLKLQIKGPLYSKTVIGTLAVDGYIWYNEEETGRGRSRPSPLLAVPNVIAHPSTASVPTSYYWMWHYNYLCPLKG